MDRRIQRRHRTHLHHNGASMPRFISFLCCALACASVALANHGPGASGGGSATASGETLKPGRFELSIREDYSQFEHFSKTAAIQRANEGGDFDALDHGFLTSVELSYGLIEDLQVNASIGYFVGRDFRSAEADNGDVEVATAQPTGMTDLAITAKYRILKGAPGNLAILGGVKFPTGRDDVHLSNSVTLSPTDQPGTGAYDFPVGIAYSRFLTSRITLDASAVYTIRTEHDDFQVGDRFDAGLALAYRLTESIQQFPQYSVFAELNNVWLQKDEDHGESDENSGSDALYFTPGFRVRFDKNAALTVAPSIPIYQELNGDQGRVEFKVAVTFSVGF
jgi:hypothetical protein